ncbi:MAG: 5-formyltetrahydrofolate cyclo-ligase [Candidatus Omnitrophota bacterium]
MKRVMGEVMPKLNMLKEKIKKRIRKEIRGKLSKQDDTQRLQKSNLIKEKLFKLAEFKQAKCVMFYIAKDKEVETQFMIDGAKKLGKKIAVPAVLTEEKRMTAALVGDLGKELCLGPYGVLQPKPGSIREIPHEKIDLVIVPGIAFDKQGIRVGRGAGYYDRFLAGLPCAVPRIGLAFSFQVLDSLPALSHDIPVTQVISA